jgi:hypothetical protein
MKIEEALKPKVGWLVKERDPKTGLWVPKVFRYNVVTLYGKTALASAPAGAYTAPIYLVIESTYATQSANSLVGATSVSLNTDPTLPGDNRIVLGVGLGSQETVTYSSKSGTNPTTFTLSTPTVNSHSSGDPACRDVSNGDDITAVPSEVQYDPTYAAGRRLQMTASYSPATGQNTMQYFIAGIQATNASFIHVGLADNPLIGTNNLHNYANLGYFHTNTNDVEIDVTWTVS